MRRLVNEAEAPGDFDLNFNLGLGTEGDLEVALGSQAEIEIQVEIARRLGCVDEATHRQVQERVETVGRLLNGLIDSLERQGAGLGGTTNHQLPTKACA